MGDTIIEAPPAKILLLRAAQQRVAERRQQQARAEQARYLHDPVAWATDCVNWPAGAQLADYQATSLRLLEERRRLALRSLHGAGKSATAALTVLWFSTTRDAAGIDWKVVTTAGAWRQLQRYLWPEIRLWARRLNWAKLGRDRFDERTELLTLNLKLAHGQAFPAASDNPALLEGAHADSVLIVADEAKAIIPDVFDAIEGALSGTGETYALATSTPGAPTGRFYDICTHRAGFEDWATIHVNLAAAVRAGRVSEEWAAQRARQWGATSAVYLNRVEGEFAASEEDSTIPLAWVEAAIERWHAWQDAGSLEPAGRRVIGVDVARTGVDQTVYATRTGNVVQLIERRHGQDTMVTAGEVVARLSWPASIAVIDVIGLGAGVLDRVREQRLPAIPYSASGRSTRKDHTGEFGFVNQRSEQWWAMRERLDPACSPDLCLPPDDELIGDLTAPRWTVTSSGKIQVEGKDDIATRLGRSTDVGDAVIHTFVTAGTVASTPAVAVPYTDRRVPGGAIPYT